MSVNQKFSFLSPGIKLNEVDLSVRGEPIVGDGALIIGQTKMGPAMTPVVVSNLSDFEAVFGPAQSGQNSDAEGWRNGNQAMPTYGAYAAQAWLASQTSPVTFVRLLGDATVSSGTKAGWSMGTPAVSTTAANNKGAYGLWVCKSGSTGNLSGTLAAVIYSQGAAVTLSGTLAGETNVGSSHQTSSIGTFIASDETAGFANAFTIEIHSSDTASEKFNISFDAGSDHFIRNVMNTDPHYLSTGQKNTNESYFVGETFETELNDLLSDESSTAAGKQFGVIFPLAQNADLGKNWSNRQMTSKKSKTGYIIANDPNPQQDTASYSAANMKKLFRLVSLHDGEEFEKRYAAKIYIDSLSTNASQYSSFTIEICKIEDGSTVETFGNLNLNPNSVNYVAAAIGNSVTSYNTTTDRWEESGEYPNKSDYIYVEMHPDASQAHKSAVPFGFYGPSKPKNFSILGSAADANPGSGSLHSNTTYAYVKSAPSASVFGGHAANGFCRFEVTATAIFRWPELKTTSSGSVSNAHYSKNAFFGVRHISKSKQLAARPYIYGNKNTQDYKDLVRALPSDLDVHGTASSDAAEVSFIFTLDDLVQDSNNSSKFFYQEGSHALGLAFTAQNGSKALVNTQEVKKLIMPFMGGFDGLDITKVDPFSSRKVLHQTTDNEINHYAYKAVKKVLDFSAPKVEDGGLIDYDIISMPGLTNTSLVRDLITNAEVRGDSLAIIDVNSGWTPKEVDYSGNARGTVNTIISNIETEEYNTSYAACYYPEVKLQDGATVPSSVAGIGAIASSERQSGAPWFAPAGFNRGGISTLGGPGGPAVKDLNVKLNKSDRDKLYVANINPIASFPAEGPVVFGQKTLQQTPSALDRINVRRLMIYLKKNVGKLSRDLLFEPNIQATWNRFIAAATPVLDDAKARFGIVDYKLVLDETTTTPALVDQNVMYAQVFVKPAYAIEFIVIDFAVTRSGIEF